MLSLERWCSLVNIRNAVFVSGFVDLFLFDAFQAIESMLVPFLFCKGNYIGTFKIYLYWVWSFLISSVFLMKCKIYLWLVDLIYSILVSKLESILCVYLYMVYLFYLILKILYYLIFIHSRIVFYMIQCSMMFSLNCNYNLTILLLFPFINVP